MAVNPIDCQSPEIRDHFKRDISSSNHQFSGDMFVFHGDMLVLESLLTVEFFVLKKHPKWFSLTVLKSLILNREELSKFRWP